ncbi:REP-associated tyrosine transposase [Fimbriimonas ginsengisoli]|uniref:Type I site-specific deoxyribonuclease, HsdR family n=1 Tax=Fimbriimonas ginsengisoli Gsoil 348 TaxID=661478 RepID=A0A068NPS5_FIMGI|nr:alcohol dehydrogenase catalytic domain-containing protein [Fimbriimonas ginsengisoli]AIE85446.1 type I site-specific deoxyribonuclease, HsdR family [Fimbriimonas ginsengisoli Gsoil 348]
MKVARYIGNGEVAIVDEAIPSCPEGGLLVRTEACGLCSGELMSWYMDRKVPHVLGHEVSGVVIESQDERFPVGSRVFPHHHAPCLQCELCRQGLYVHCPHWKRTKLAPGGMADFFAVDAENLTDTLRTDDLRPVDAALIEPLACVVKSIRRGTGFQPMGITTVPGVDKVAPSTQAADELVVRQGANLPHWTRPGATYSVTFRLADAVPRHVREEWRLERERLAAMADRLTERELWNRKHLHAERVQSYLNEGHGSSILRDHRAAGLVQEGLKHFDGERYRLYAWCVMPNHVHAIVEPLPGYELAEILHSWKSFTARQVNKLLGRTGDVWQSESYDHLIRDAEDYQHALDYVLYNPAKAGLLNYQFVGETVHRWRGGAGRGEHARDGRDTHGLEARATAAVIGLGVMGLMHCLLLPGSVGYDLSPGRIEWATRQGIDARLPDDAEPADVIFVCPGSQAAFDFAMRIANPGATIVMFAPLGPGEALAVPQEAYFRDITIRHSYSCGPEDTREAAEAIRDGKLKAEQVVSEFIGMDELPRAYGRMKRGEILKPMIVWDDSAK